MESPTALPRHPAPYTSIDANDGSSECNHLLRELCRQLAIISPTKAAAMIRQPPAHHCTCPHKKKRSAHPPVHAADRDLHWRRADQARLNLRRMALSDPAPPNSARPIHAAAGSGTTDTVVWK